MSRIRILVLYWSLEKKSRKTINDHLYSFKRYDKQNEYFYFNAVWGLPSYLSLIPFDAIFLHYTLLITRWNTDLWKKFYFPNFKRVLSKMQVLKVAFPQDEYAHTECLCHLFRDCNVEVVFTCAYPIDYRKLYPENISKVKHLFTTYTGFVDEETLRFISSSNFFVKNQDRKIDIGYRARNLPYWLGRHGQLKFDLARFFMGEKDLYPDMIMDISTSPSDVFIGNDWIYFLCNCRVVLGCLGGASLLDFDGSVRRNVEDYVARHPEASFNEVENNCFLGLDGNIGLFALSPRHFECAITKTCQVLVEGDYNGVLRPGVDFIELKKDYSNIEEVMKLVQDKEYCAQIADNCFKKVVLSGEYTYEKFVKQVHEKLGKNYIAKESSEKDVFRLIENLFLKILGYSQCLQNFKKMVMKIVFKMCRVFRFLIKSMKV